MLLNERVAQGIGLVFALLGDLILLAGVVRFRTFRISGSDVPFITLEFAVLGILAILLALFAVFAVRAVIVYQRLNRLNKLTRLAAIIIVVLVIRVAFSVLALIIPAVEIYLPPYLTWLWFLSLALFIAYILPTSTGASGKETRFGQWFARNQKKIGRAVLLIVIYVTAPFLILEIGMRIWFSNFGTEAERIIYTYSPEDISRASTQYKGIPYLNYGLSPEYWRHNSLGYRGPETTLEKPDGVFRIVAMGGSTTYNGNVDEQDSYPRLLETILREQYGYTNVEVINAGTPGYTTWETLVNFEFRVLDLDPDMIILFQGVNDLAPRVYPPELYRGLSPSAELWRTSAPDLSPSVLYRYITYNLGLMPNPRSLRSQMLTQFPGLDCCELLPDDLAAERMRENPPIYYESNLRSIVAIAQANQVEVMMSTWVYFPDETSVPGGNSMVKPYRQEAIAEHNDVVRSVAAEMDVPLYDLAASLPYNPDYWTSDGVHMAERGLLDQSEQYAAFLDREHLIPKPGESN